MTNFIFVLKSMKDGLINVLPYFIISIYPAIKATNWIWEEYIWKS